MGAKSPAAGGKGVWGQSPQLLAIYNPLDDFSDFPFFGMFHLKFCLKLLKFVHYCMSLYLNAAF